MHVLFSGACSFSTIMHAHFACYYFASLYMYVVLKIRKLILSDKRKNKLKDMFYQQFTFLKWLIILIATHVCYDRPTEFVNYCNVVLLVHVKMWVCM